MTPAGLAKFLYLAYLSKPPAERALYRAIRKRQPRNIVELGIGDGRRALRLIQVAQRYRPGDRVAYTAIDPFESGNESDSISLKAAYKLLAASGARVQLEPGDPYWGLLRKANSLTATDLLIISRDHDASALARAWFYVPRMLHADSLVFLEEASGATATFRPIALGEVASLARSTAQRRAA